MSDKDSPVIIPIRDKQAVIKANSDLLTGLAAFVQKHRGPYAVVNLNGYVIMPVAGGTHMFAVANEMIARLLCELMNEIFYHQFPAAKPVEGLLT